MINLGHLIGCKPKIMPSSMEECLMLLLLLFPFNIEQWGIMSKQIQHKSVRFLGFQVASIGTTLFCNIYKFTNTFPDK